MNDIKADQIRRGVTLAEAAKYLRGRNGKTVHITSIRKWASPSVGWKAPDGSRVVLKTIDLNAQLLTLPEWCEEFDLARARANDRARQAKPKGPARTSRQREAAAKRAMDQLNKSGRKGKTKKPTSKVA